MRYQHPIVAPSILAADFSNMQSALRVIEDSGADWIHMDVMDGHFVPNITFGPKMIADLRPHSRLPFDVHIMINNPQDYVDSFVQAGADYLVFHLESAVHAHRVVQQIRNLGCRPGISIVPSTPVILLKELLPFVDQVLVMSVNPGFGGQVYIEGSEQKIRELVQLRTQLKADFLINVDGGIQAETAGRAVEAGADVLVSGSAFFSSKDKSAYVAMLKGEKRV